LTLTTKPEPRYACLYNIWFIACKDAMVLFKCFRLIKAIEPGSNHGSNAGKRNVPWCLPYVGSSGDAEASGEDRGRSGGGMGERKGLERAVGYGTGPRKGGQMFKTSETTVLKLSRKTFSISVSCRRNHGIRGNLLWTLLR